LRSSCESDGEHKQSDEQREEHEGGEHGGILCKCAGFVPRAIVRGMCRAASGEEVLAPA
jgi:hypothetical protein